jgi:NADPH-dependent glutamate synthase beta subunit-like oxidoreductase
VSVYDIHRISVPVTPPGYADDTRDLHYVPAPCQVACPIGTDAPSYIGYIWEGRYEEAFEAITATNPFSSICGRVCDAPCEPACRRTSSDGTVQIRNLKRHVMDKLGAEHVPAAVAITRAETIGIVGSGPTGLTAAHDLAVAGFEVHVYEMTDRLGGLMVWGIPAFRLPPGVIEEDIKRLKAKCPSIRFHLNTGLGQQVTLEELKHRHDAVLLAIGSWWGKPMDVRGEDHPMVVDGVSFLRRVNAGERPSLPHSVVVIGGGDVAMDACRVAKRLPGCTQVKVIYRRGPDEIPAREIELHHAIKEDIEFIYNTLQVSVDQSVSGLTLNCVRTELAEPDEDGRRRPEVISGSEHTIDCGMVIAAVGQQAESAELAKHQLMGSDRVLTDFASMRTSDAKVFAAGDGAFGGSTLVMAMHHGQRAAYYVQAFLDGNDDPVPYRTPYRTRRVPVAQDLSWELFPVQEPVFHGVGKSPETFPEIEDTYDDQVARREAARCYRCDAETGSADYAVRHREDIFSMARINPMDQQKHRAMLAERLSGRDNPFPEGRPPSLDDLVFLPANLSRLVIDPYREHCRTDVELGGRLSLDPPFLVTGLDHAPADVKCAAAKALSDSGAAYIGEAPVNAQIGWLQVVPPAGLVDKGAVGVFCHWKHHQQLFPCVSDTQAKGLLIDVVDDIDAALDIALANDVSMLLLDASGTFPSLTGELSSDPKFEMLDVTVQSLRKRRREETLDLIYFGGARSGTDAAKLIAMGASVVVFGVAVALAAGGEIAEHDLIYAPDRNADERAAAISSIVRANAGEASMMARCTGKTRLHNLEPEDLRSITLATAAATGIPLTGHQSTDDDADRPLN